MSERKKSLKDKSGKSHNCGAFDTELLNMDTKNPVGLFNSDLDFESYLSETVVKAGRNDKAYKAAKHSGFLKRKIEL